MGGSDFYSHLKIQCSSYQSQKKLFHTPGIIFQKKELFPIVEYDLAPECQGLYCNKNMGLTKDLTQPP